MQSAWYIILSFNQLSIIEILPYWLVAKNIGNYRKYDFFFNFPFTGDMIFSLIAENQENMIFKLSGFTKVLFFTQWYIGRKIQNQGFLIIRVFWLSSKSYTIATSPIPIKEEISTKKEIKFWFHNFFLNSDIVKKANFLSNILQAYILLFRTF